MKLPDLNYNRRVPNLKSSKMAELPNKLRNINVAVQETRRLNNTVQTAIDNEARLDAAGRFQEMERDYITRRADLLQEYHSTDKPLTEYQQDIESLRQEVFTAGGETASMQTKLYLQPRMDAFDTQATVFEKETFLKLAESRSIMHVAKAAEGRLQNVYDDPNSALLMLEAGKLELGSSGIDQVKQEALHAEQTNAILATATERFLASDDVAGAVKLTDSPEWMKMPLSQRARLDGAIQEASFKSMSDWAEEQAYMLAVGEGNLDTSLAAVPGQVQEVAYNLTPAQEDDAIRGTSGNLVYRKLENDINEGRTAEATAVLKSGKYKDVLTAKQAEALYSATLRASSGNSFAANVSQVSSRRGIDSIIDSVNRNPRVAASETTVVQLQQLTEELTAASGGPDGLSDTDIGKIMEAEEALRQGRATLDVWNSPNNYATKRNAIALSPNLTPELEEELNLINASLETRRKEIKTDPIGFFREQQGLGIDPLPYNENFPAALPKRLDQWRTLQSQTGADLGGPLEPADIEFLTTQAMGSNANIKSTAAAIVTALPDITNSAPVFDQLALEDETGLLPTVGLLTAAGQDVIADQVLAGQDILTSKDSPLKPDKISEVEGEIKAQLGGAYGSYGDAQYEQTVKAALALYTYKAATPGNRGKSPNVSELVETSIAEVTGGVFDIGGQDFVAPNPTVDRDQMIGWLRGQSEATLPPMVDGTGAPIPSAEVADDLDRGTFGNGGRFLFIPSGTPGKYYIGDTYNMVGGRPTLLMSREDTSLPAVKGFDPSEIRYNFATPRRRR